MCLCTCIGEPNAAPNDLWVEVVTGDSAVIVWNGLDCSKQNGPLTGYKVHVKQISGDCAQKFEITTRGNYNEMSSCELDSLIPSTRYRVQVSAVNSFGRGPLSYPFHFVTLGSQE